MIARTGELSDEPVAGLGSRASALADDAMVHALRHQARALWPQERELLSRHPLPENLSILDAGCRTGEVSFRLACLFPRAHVLGVDLIDEHLERARSCFGALTSRLTFAQQDLLALGIADGSFDLTVCRHVSHALGCPEAALDELVRVTRAGGRLHLVLEDYGIVHYERRGAHGRPSWHEFPAAFAPAGGTDPYGGRRLLTLLRGRGLADVTIDYMVVDTLRIRREAFAAIVNGWRDGYAPAITGATRFTWSEALAHFDAMLATILDPDGYAVWMVPVASARVCRPPGGGTVSP